MKNNKVMFLLLFTLVLSQSIFSGDNKKLSNLEGDYLGQTPPGNDPQLFAPGIVSTEYFEHSSPTFSPDGSEMYWSVHYPDGYIPENPILYMMKVNGQWTEPKVADFSGDYYGGNPFFSPDGNKIYFQSDRPIEKGNKSELTDIWYVKKNKLGWSEPIHLNKGVNSDKREAQPTISEKGTLFFISFFKDARPPYGLYYSEFINGKFREKKLMDSSFNTPYPDWTPYVAPDESYFIFCSFRPGGFGSGDLYISYKQKDGSWGKIKNMGNKINTSRNDRFPNVTPDGKYLLYNSTRYIEGADAHMPGNGKGDVYWVSSNIINHLKNENMNVIGLLTQTFEDKGAKAVKEMFDSLKIKHSEYFNFDETVLYLVAIDFLQSQNVSSALEIFQMNTKLFPQKQPASQKLLMALFDENSESFNNYYRQLVAQLSTKDNYLEGEFNSLGYRLNGIGFPKKAFKIFEMNVKLFPASANVYDSFAEINLKMGNKKSAIQNYEKSLELNPDNKNAKNELEKLIQE